MVGDKKFRFLQLKTKAAAPATFALTSLLTPLIRVLDAQTTTHPSLSCKRGKTDWLGVCCVLGTVGRNNYLVLLACAG